LTAIKQHSQTGQPEVQKIEIQQEKVELTLPPKLFKKREEKKEKKKAEGKVPKLSLDIN
jgi:hypothetical protein